MCPRSTPSGGDATRAPVPTPDRAVRPLARYDENVAGRRVVIVNDIVNTGHSVRRTAEAVRAAGGYAHGRKWVSLHGQPNRR